MKRELVDTELGVGGVGEADAAGGAREFFEDYTVCLVAEFEAAVVLFCGNAEEALREDVIISQDRYMRRYRIRHTQLHRVSATCRWGRRFQHRSCERPLRGSLVLDAGVSKRFLFLVRSYSYETY